MATNFEILKNCLNGGNNNEAANILAELCTAFRDCNSCGSCIKRILHWGCLSNGRRFFTDYRDESIFRDKFNFNSFIRTENNRYAFDLCYAISENPGKLFNPCLITGGTGLGKTHLLHSIRVKLEEEKPDSTVLYLKCKDFINEFISSVCNNSQNRFIKKYHSADVFLLDDFQYICNKPATQSELIDIFEGLLGNDCQLVLTCSYSPNELTGLSERMKSYITSAVQAKISVPDKEAKLHILRYKFAEAGIPAKEETIDEIADKSSDVRSLLSGVKNVLADSYK